MAHRPESKMAENRQQAPSRELAFASVTALLVALVADFLATLAALRDRAILKSMAENFGTELSGFTVFAHSLPTSAIVAAAIVVALALAVKEFVVPKRLICCVLNILGFALISIAYWGYHHALLSPVMFTLHSLS
jgi:hypothetical protein